MIVVSIIIQMGIKVQYLCTVCLYVSIDCSEFNYELKFKV